MKTAQDVRKREYEMLISIISLDYEVNFFWTSELVGIMDRYKHDLGRSLVPSKPFVCLQLLAVSCGTNYNRVRMAICSGFFRNAAKKGKLVSFMVISVPGC